MQSATDARNTPEDRFRDLRTVLIHEHGHAAVAHHFGGLGAVHVRRNPNGGLEEKHFRGTFNYFKPMSRGGKRALILLGLAGFLAQFQDHAPEGQKSDADLAATSWAIANEQDANSESDLALAEGATISDFRRCLRLLDKLHDQIMCAVEIDLRDGIDSERWDAPSV